MNFFHSTNLATIFSQAYNSIIHLRETLHPTIRHILSTLSKSRMKQTTTRKRSAKSLKQISRSFTRAKFTQSIITVAKRTSRAKQETVILLPVTSINSPQPRATNKFPRNSRRFHFIPRWAYLSSFIFLFDFSIRF